jgi:hypothetical protein
MKRFLTLICLFFFVFAYAQTGVMNGILEYNTGTTTTTLTGATTNVIGSTIMELRTPRVDVTRPDGETGSVSLYVFSKITNNSAGIICRGYNTGYGSINLQQVRGSFASPASTLSGSTMGRVFFSGATTTNNNATTTTYIEAKASENFSATAQGAKISFYTTKKTTASSIERFAILDNGSIVFVPVNTGEIVAGTGITEGMLSADMRFNGTSPINITANPQIVAGTDGQIIEITGLSDTNTLTLDNGTGLVLSGTLVLGINDIVRLKYVASSNAWVQVSFQNN